MTSIRKFCGLFAALAFASLAAPALAQSTKLYTLNVGPTALPAGEATTATAIYKNTSPTGISTINWIVLSPPSPSVTLSVVSKSSGNVVTCPATVNNDLGNPVSVAAGSICISGMTGVKPGKTFTLVVSAAVDGSAACTSAQWSTVAGTGNSFVGTTFRLQPTSENPATKLDAAVGCDGLLGCDVGVNNFAGSLDPNQDAAYIGDPNWGLIRLGPAGCPAGAYKFVFDGANKYTSMIWGDKANQPNPVFFYVVLWNPVVAAGNWGFRPYVAWVTDAAGKPVKIGTTEVKVLAPLCNGDDVTLPVSELMPDNPNEEPYITFAAAGYADYTPGQPARACVLQQGWTPSNVGGVPYLQWWTKLLDNDAWVGAD